MRTTLKDSLKNITVSGKGKIIARNTFRYINESGDIVTRLHNTNIVTKTLSGKTILNSGGYQSKTTKERLNDFSGYRVNQNKGVWYVSGENKTIPFYDGMILPDSFSQNFGDKAAKDNKKLLKDISRFCDLLDGMKETPLPNQGDCFICSMFNRGNPKGDSSCLISHIEEGYLHGSLCVNALRSAGYNDSGIGIYMTDKTGFGKRQVKRSLRKYLKKSLGLPS